MVVGEQIRKAREAKHWKQKELATRVHVEPQTISEGSGAPGVPDWDKLEVLARELERPLSYFVSDGEATAAPDPALAGEVAESRVLLEAIASARSGWTPNGSSTTHDFEAKRLSQQRQILYFLTKLRSRASRPLFADEQAATVADAERERADEVPPRTRNVASASDLLHRLAQQSVAPHHPYFAKSGRP